MISRSFFHNVVAKSFILSLLCLLSSQALSAAQGQTKLTLATTLYTRKDYAGATSLLRDILHTDLRNADAYYLLGNCYVRLGNCPLAFKAYSAAVRLSPRSSAGSYAEQAMTKLNVKAVPKSTVLRTVSAGRPAPVIVSEPDEVSDQNSDGGSDDERMLKSVQGRGKKVPTGTLELIRKQAQLARENALRTGRQEADGEREKAENQARSIQEQAEKAAARGLSGHEPVSLSASELEAVRAQAAATAARVKEVGNWKANIKEMESQEKSDEIKEQAENLQHRLIDDSESKRDSIKINPVGTNLYTRNYSTSHKVLVPLRAPDAVTFESLAAKDLKGKIRAGANTEVHGILIQCEHNKRAANRNRD